MKERKVYRRLIALIISITLCITMIPLQVFAMSNDTQHHWAADVIEEWLSKGMASGYPDGSFRPDNSITRAEFMVLVNNAFGFYEEASIGFLDVLPKDWYYSTIKKAMAVGYISGYQDGTIRPNKPITRQEAAVIIARIKKLEKNSMAASSLVDLSDTADWSIDYVGAVISAGYMGVYLDGSFKPTSPLKRGEAIVALNEAIKPITAVYDRKGTFGPNNGLEIIDGDAVVKADGVVLQNLHVKGDLTISEEVGGGNIVLNNVRVDGNTYIRGGGKDSIHIYGGSFTKIIIQKTSTGQVRIVASNTYGIEVVIAEEALGESIILNGSFKNVTIEADNVDLQLQEGTKVEEMNITSEAEGTIITLGNLSVIRYLLIEESIETKGNGRIIKADIRANGVMFNRAPEDVIIGDSVTVLPKTTTLIIPPIVQPSEDIDLGNSQIAVDGVSVNPTTMALLTGGSIRGITATITPSNATNKGILWSSSNPSVATVVNGIVTPISAGTAIITASSAENPAINATTTVQVLNLVSMAPFIPGEGGTITYNSLLGEASDLGLLLFRNSERWDGVNRTNLAYYEGNISIDDLTLQYKDSSGEWQNAYDFVEYIYEDYSGWYNITLNVEAPYQYRMVDGYGKASNIVVAYLFEDEEYYGGFDFFNDFWKPFVGEVIESYYMPYTSNNSYTYSYQWYRVNPKSFELVAIEGANSQAYVRAEEDADYYLMVNAYLSGGASTPVAQAIVTIPTIIPNKAYVTNVTDTGFTLNLYKAVEGLTPEDLVLYSGEEITISSVTPGDNNTIYYIEADLSDKNGPFFLWNRSTAWKIVTEYEDGYIEYEIGFTKGQVIDISHIVNGGILVSSETEGVTLDLTPGAEKAYIASGVSVYHGFYITIINSNRGTIEDYYIYNDRDGWTIVFMGAEVDISQHIADGFAETLLNEYYMDINNDDKIVYIYYFQEDMVLFFDVIGGANDGKRFKLFHDNYFRVEEITDIITSIEIIGPDNLELKRYEPNPNVTYTAVVRDHNGDIMEKEEVTWSIKVPTWPMDIGATTGIFYSGLTTAPPDSITLVATSKLDTSIKGEHTINLTLEARNEKAITGTSIGVISNGNIDIVPAGTKVSELKAGFTVSEGATVEILQESQGTAVENQEETQVNSTMVIEVTAENGTKAEYSITMATYLVELRDGSNVNVEGTTISMSGGLGIAHWYPWDHTARLVKVIRTGTGDITNITITVSEPDKFDVCYEHPANSSNPGLWTENLVGSRTASYFYVHAKEGLEPGVHTATYTVTADNGISKEFHVDIFVVFDSSYQD